MPTVDKFFATMQAGHRQRYANRLRSNDYRYPASVEQAAVVLDFPTRSQVFTGSAGA